MVRSKSNWRGRTASKLMDDNLRRAVESRVDQCCANTPAGIALHLLELPAALADLATTFNIQFWCEAVGQTNLSAMGMAREIEVNACIGSVAILLRAMIEQKHQLSRCPSQRLLQVG